MFAIFNQVLTLLIFVAAGYALGKSKVAQTEHTKTLSGLLVYVFLSCNVFKTFSSRFTPDYIAANYRLLLISTGLLCTLLVASHFAAKLFSKNKYEQCIYDYTLVVPNYGYMGYALSEALLGQAGLMNFMTFSIPVSLYIYSLGFAKLTKQGISLKKLCNPVIISMVLGMIAGLTGIKLPAICNDVIDKSASCMAPASMLLTGIVISGFPLKNMLCSGKNYIMVALRLLGIPLVMGGILSLFGDAQLVQTAVLFYALPCGLNTVVFPKLIDENCEIGAGLAMISNVICCLTLPLVLSLFGIG